MDKQLTNPQPPASNGSGFNPFDLAALGGALVGGVGGTIFSIVSSQFAVATVALPLSASIALNVLNRKQMMEQISEQVSQSQQSVSAQISQQIGSVQSSIAQLSQLQKQSAEQLTQQTEAQQKSLETLTEQVIELQQFAAGLNHETEKLSSVDRSLEQQQKQLEAVVVELREIQEITQKMSANPNSAEFYFQRGLSQERLGDKQKAIEDYTESIRLDASHAGAYYHRGLLHRDVGHRKKAVEDLRKAAKYFLEQGDVEKYQEARNLSQELHDLRSVAASPEVEMNHRVPAKIAVGGLFS
jgi:tetratricopeptide (TPR) repeat protein